MVPPRTLGRRTDAASLPQGQSFEAVKRRVLARLEDRLDLGASRRMPASLLRQTLRQQAEQTADQEGRGLSAPERDRVVEDVLGELLGYGPLEELFGDPGVREIMVTGPGAVIVRREQGHWLPTSVKFRDEGHVRATLDRMAGHAEPVGPVNASVACFDVRLSNGFRAVAVVPPEALGLPATAAFVREAKEAGSGIHPGLPAPGPGSSVSGPPPSRSGTIDAPAERDPIARYRQRILERMLRKMANLRVYDVQKVETTELRKIVAAYTDEFCQNESIYLSETDRGRITLEILTSLGR